MPKKKCSKKDWTKERSAAWQSLFAWPRPSYSQMRCHSDIFDSRNRVFCFQHHPLSCSNTVCRSFTSAGGASTFEWPCPSCSQIRCDSAEFHSNDRIQTSVSNAILCDARRKAVEVSPWRAGPPTLPGRVCPASKWATRCTSGEWDSSDPVQTSVSNTVLCDATM